jgi:sigma-B regulation protein RsbU (phosphoserine phosphatase)
MADNQKKILIVEDDRASLLILVTLFRKWGYDVLSAEDGAEAWKIYLDDDDIQLILSDWMMPVVDGVELCNMVRSRKDRRYTYFLLLTAKSQVNDIVAGIEAGADDFITKPFNHPELKVRVMAGERIINLENELANKVKQLSKASERIRSDLEAAAAMQQSLLPPASGEQQGLKYSSIYIPCEKIGGDLFNMVPLGKTHMGIYIFDVSGHGVPAALQSVAMGRMLSNYNPDASILLSPGINERSPIITSPDEVSNQLNSRFQSTYSKGDFITFLYGVLELETGKFTYTRAGHPAPIIIHDGKIIDINDKGDIPIGIIPNYNFTNYTLHLEPGDRIFFYTDGISEAFSPNGTRYGKEAMGKHLTDTIDRPLIESISGLIKALEKWHEDIPTVDDMSILGLEIKF